MSEVTLQTMTIRKQIKRTCYYDHKIDHKEMQITMAALVYHGDDISVFSASYNGMEVGPGELIKFIDAVLTISPCELLIMDTGPLFIHLPAFKSMIARHDVELRKSEPHTPWIKGKIERTLKQMSDFHRRLNTKKKARGL